MKKVLSLFLAALVLISVFYAFPVSAATSGTCGDNLTWTLNDSGTLTISGTGAMYDYVNPSSVPTPSHAAPWYSSRLKVKALKVDSGVTSIGDYAFYACDMKNADLPTSIKTIGSHSFYKCGFKKINLPDSITKIGSSAFSWCTHLEEINIPESCKEIGDHSFYLTMIKQLYIPENVENFFDLTNTSDDGLNNFYSYHGGFNNIPYTLEKITVSKNNQNFSDIDGVLYDKSGTKLLYYPESRVNSSYSVPAGTKTILDMWGRNVTNISLPDSLTKIFYLAANCTTIYIPKNVKEIVRRYDILGIGGNKVENIYVNPENAMYSSQDGILYDKAKKTLMYYPPQKKDERFVVPSSVKTISAYRASNRYLKTLIISNGVTKIDSEAFNFSQNLTNIEIPASVVDIPFSAFYDGCSSLSTISGYTGTAAEEYANKRGLIFNELNYSSSKKTNTSIQMIRDGVVYDLLKERQIFSKASEETVDIIVAPNWQGKKAGKILISQGGSNYIVSTTGKFNDIRPADIFDADGNILLILVTEDGKTIESQRIQLQITSTSAVKNLNSGTLFDDFYVEVPDTVPILGDSKCGLSMGSIDFEFECDEDGFKATLGTAALEGKKGADGKWEEEDWKDLVAGFKDAEKMIKQGKYNYLKNIAPPKTRLSLKDNVGGKVSVTGYLEGYFTEDGRMKIREGGIIIAGEIKHSYQGMTLVGAVPLYYEVGAGGKLEFVCGAKGYVPDEGVLGALTGSLTPSFSLEAGGGVGIPYVMTAGVKGKVTSALEIALDRWYQKFTVKGSANFQWKGPFNAVLYERDFAKSTWYIYETGNPDTLLGSTIDMYSLDDIYDNIDLEAPVQLENRDYLLTPSEWLGGVDYGISTYSVDYTNKQLSVLEENAYRDANPIIANMKGTKVMAWVTDNGDRDAINKSMLVYSVYNENDNTWTVPAPLLDNGTADFYPAMKDGYIVWQKANVKFDDKTSINDMSRSSEIYVAKWNGSGFDEAVRITNNSTIDTKPTLAVTDGIAHIVWTTNTEDNFMGTAGTNFILTSSYDGSDLSEQSIVASELPAITNMSASYTDALNVYYVTDTDNDYSTVVDRDVYQISGNEKSQITSNNTLNSNPIAVNVDNDEWLFWYSDGNIVYKNPQGKFEVFDELQNGITDDFDVISNGKDIVIIWTTTNDGGAEIQGVFYDGATWSKDIQITELGENVKYPHGIMDENGKLTLAFNRTQKIPTEDYYTDGQADLCTLQVTPSYDIAVDDAMLGSYELVVGENSLLVDVVNKGELSVDSYAVQITDEQGNQLGEYVSETSLSAGEKKTIDVPFIIDETFTAQKIFATISAENVDEYNVYNNSTSVEAGSADAKIAGTAIGENKVSVTIKNAGFENVNEITIALSDGTSTNPQTKTIETIASKEAAVVEFDVELSSLAFDEDGYGALTVTLNADADSNESNNETTVIVSKLLLNKPYNVTLHSMSNISSGSIINANVQNNLQYDKKATIIAAIYDDDRLVSVQTKDEQIVAEDYTIVDFEFNDITLNKEYTVKLFIWNDLTNLMPLGALQEYLCSDYIQ